jgi:hypothetical protein
MIWYFQFDKEMYVSGMLFDKKFYRVNYPATITTFTLARLEKGSCRMWKQYANGDVKMLAKRGGVEFNVDKHEFLLVQLQAVDLIENVL